MTQETPDQVKAEELVKLSIAETQVFQNLESQKRQIHQEMLKITESILDTRSIQLGTRQIKLAEDFKSLVLV